MLDLKCDWCGKDIQRYPSHIHERNFCTRACLGKYRTEHLTGTKAAHWKGGEKPNGGRVMWHLPWHPGADSGGYVYRYRIVAELKLGRFLAPGEVVHHIDGNSENDHPDNIEVLPNQAEHARMHGRERTPEQMAYMRSKRKNAA